MLGAAPFNPFAVHAQDSAATAQQLPMPLPAATASITNVHLRPQLDQYNDMARFLGYHSSSSSLPSSQQDRSNHSQASSQSAFHPPSSSRSPAGIDLPVAQPAAPEHGGLYPNDHAMHLPASRAYRPTPTILSDNPWEELQRHASSTSSTSTSSKSSCSSHGRSRRQQPSYSNRQADRQDHGQPSGQSDGQHNGQLNRQLNGRPNHQLDGQMNEQLNGQANGQLHTPVPRVAASPFMASVEHSYVPISTVASPFMADAQHSFTPVNPFASPFMADAEHSYVPSPASAQHSTPDPWEAFGSPTFPTPAPATANRRQQGNDSFAQYAPAGRPHSVTVSVSTGPPYTPNSTQLPTEQFSYLDLLGPSQGPPSFTPAQQPQHAQHAERPQHEQYGEHREQRQQREQDRHEQQRHQQQRQQQHQHDRDQHRQEREQHRHERDEHRQNWPQHQRQYQRHSNAPGVGQGQGQGQGQQQYKQRHGGLHAGSSWSSQPVHSSQPSHASQPTGTSSDPLPGLNAGAHSAFDSFDALPSGNAPLCEYCLIA